MSDDLPLVGGVFYPAEQDGAPGAIDDARPDRWGERVIRRLSPGGRLSTLEFLFRAGDDRFGCLGISDSAFSYEPYSHQPSPTLSDVDEIHRAVQLIEEGAPVDESIKRLIAPGASMGGARPKALVDIDGEPYLVKFSERGDEFDTPLVEHASMLLATKAGIVASRTIPIKLKSGHAVAVSRFDRSGGLRHHCLSAKTALRAAGYATFGYPQLAQLLRQRGDSERIQEQGEQLFRRMVFNIAMDNTDDHEKNHAVVVRGHHYELSPAFDVLPTCQSLGYQQMVVGRHGQASSIENALSQHKQFLLAESSARSIAAEVCKVASTWKEEFAKVGVSSNDIDAIAQHVDRDTLASERQQAQSLGVRAGSAVAASRPRRP